MFGSVGLTLTKSCCKDISCNWVGLYHRLDLNGIVLNRFDLTSLLEACKVRSVLLEEVLRGSPGLCQAICPVCPWSATCGDRKKDL